MKKYYAFIVIILGIFLVFSFSNFFNKTKEITIQSSLTHLKDVSSHIYTNYDQKYKSLLSEIETTSHLFSNHYDSKLEQKKLLNNLENNKNLFKRIWYIDNEKKCYNYKLNQYINIQEDFINDIFDGKTDISDVFLSPYNKKNIIAVYTPVYYQQKLLGGLIGIIEIDDLFYEDMFQGNAYVFITTKEGKIVSKIENDKILYNGNNYFDFLNNNVEYINGSYDGIMTSIQNLYPGYMSFYCQGENRVGYFEPAPINEWYIFTISSQNELEYSNHLINKNTYLLIFEISLVFIIGFSLIAHYLININKKNKIINKQLNESHKKIELILKLTSDCICEYNIEEDSLTLSASENKPKTLLNHFIKNLHNYNFVKNEFEELLKEKFNALKNGENMIYMDAIFPYFNKNEEKWYHLSMIKIKDSPIVIGTFKDKTNEMNQYHHLMEERLYKNSVYANALFMFCLNIKKRKVIIYQENGIYSNIVDYDYENVFLNDFIKNVYEDDQDKVRDYLDYQRIIELSQNYKNKMIEFRLKDSQHSYYHWVRFRIQLEKQNNELLMIAYGNNIDDEKIKQLEIKYNAERDELTGLYNRQTFRKKVNKYLSQPHFSYHYSAYMVFDLDNFKPINDNLGHLEGDRVLSEVANILKKEFNRNSYVGRFGGDEFVMFVYNQISFADVEEKLNHILQEIKNIELKEEYKVTASIGVCFVDHEKTSKELFTKCDQVLYECKNSGKNSFKIFNK